MLGWSGLAKGNDWEFGGGNLDLGDKLSITYFNAFFVPWRSLYSKASSKKELV
jgi:hypothetical protein